MRSRKIILGTRGSKLALFQSNLVLKKLQKLYPNYLFDLSDFKVIDSKIKSIISDVDDEVKTCIISNNINYNFYFSWVSQKTRKPYFKFELIFRIKLDCETEWYRPFI